LKKWGRGDFIARGWLITVIGPVQRRLKSLNHQFLVKANSISFSLGKIVQEAKGTGFFLPL